MSEQIFVCRIRQYNRGEKRTTIMNEANWILLIANLFLTAWLGFGIVALREKIEDWEDGDNE